MILFVAFSNSKLELSAFEWMKIKWYFKSKVKAINWHRIASLEMFEYFIDS